MVCKNIGANAACMLAYPSLQACGRLLQIVGRSVSRSQSPRGVASHRSLRSFDSAGKDSESALPRD
jgi:hypothetical protein